MTHQHSVSGASCDRYSQVAIVLHWAIAAFIIFNLCSGWFIESWLHGTFKESTPPHISWLSLVLHASSGLTVLALTVVRVVWRLINAPPPYPTSMKPWEQHTATLAHFALYAAMLLMPLTGWAILSAHPPANSRGAASIELPRAPAASVAPQTIKIWNLIPMPVIAPIEAIGKEPGGVAAQHVLHEHFAKWHGVGGYLLLGLLLLHILGALKHQFIDKQSEFARMWINRS